MTNSANSFRSELLLSVLIGVATALVYSALKSIGRKILQRGRAVFSR